MKIEIGKMYLLEGGRKAFVAARFPTEITEGCCTRSLIGWEFTGQIWIEQSWLEDGSYFGCPSIHNIVKLLE